MGIILVISMFFAINQNPQKSFFGYRFYNILTNSMNSGKKDGFGAGDMIIIKVTDAKDIKIGDIITFVPGNNSKSYLTHRVVEIKDKLNQNKGTFFVTKGDINNSEDPPISSTMLIGKKIFTIPFIGGILNFLRSNIIVCLMFMITFISMLMVNNYR